MVLLEIILAVLVLAVIAYVTLSYRQGSFPISRLRRDAKRAARRARQLDREESEH